MIMVTEQIRQCIAEHVLFRDLALDDEEIVPDNFDSISRLATFIERRTPAKA
jgi:hypothetical protein